MEKYLKPLDLSKWQAWAPGSIFPARLNPGSLDIYPGKSGGQCVRKILVGGGTGGIIGYPGPLRVGVEFLSAPSCSETCKSRAFSLFFSPLPLLFPPLFFPFLSFFHNFYSGYPGHLGRQLEIATRVILPGYYPGLTGCPEYHYPVPF